MTPATPTYSDLVLAHNNCSVSSEACPVCGGEAGRRIGGSRIPLEIFLREERGGPVCPPCAARYAPELVKACNLYYAAEEEKWREERAMLDAGLVPVTSDEELPF